MGINKEVAAGTSSASGLHDTLALRQKPVFDAEPNFPCWPYLPIGRSVDGGFAHQQGTTARCAGPEAALAQTPPLRCNIAKSLCNHSKCTELALEQHDFDECPTPQPAGRLNVGYFQVETRPFVL